MHAPPTRSTTERAPSGIVCRAGLALLTSTISGVFVLGSFCSVAVATSVVIGRIVHLAGRSPPDRADRRNSQWPEPATHGGSAS